MQLISIGGECAINALCMEYYEIIVKQHLDKKRASYFDGMNITLLTVGDTILSGPVTDQAELHSILNRIRDLGLVLVSVKKRD